MNRFLFLLLILPAITFAQNDLSKLDSRNGFNKFKLGTTVKDNKAFTHLKQLSKSTKTQEEIYEVKDLEDFKLFGYTVSNIFLYFYKDQLWDIEVKLPDRQPFSQDYLKAIHISDGIRDEYGPASRIDTSLQAKQINKRREIYWEGSVVTLIHYVSIDSNTQGDRWIFLSNRIATERANDLGSNSNGL